MNLKLIGVLMLVIQNGYMFMNWFISAFQPHNVGTWLNTTVFAILGLGAVWFSIAVVLITTKQKITVSKTDTA